MARRHVLMTWLVTLSLVLVAAGAAWAAGESCGDHPCAVAGVPMTPVPHGSLMVAYTPWNQMPYDEVVDYPGAPRNERGFRLTRGTLGVAGHLYYTWLTYEVEAIAEQGEDGTYDFGLEKASIRGAWAPASLSGSAFVPTSGMTIGAMKIPFSGQSLTSTPAMQFINRPMVVEEMPIRYDIGATIDENANILRDTIAIDLRLGAFNGRGDRQFAADDNDNLHYAGRARVDFLRPEPKGEGDGYDSLWALFQGDVHLPNVGLGYSMLQNNDLAQLVKAWGAEAEINWHGLSVSAETIATRYEPEFGENVVDDIVADTWETSGWFVQGGAFVWPGRIELTGRYEEFNLDLLTDNVDERLLANTTAGFNYHLIGPHVVKLMGNYIRRAELKGMPELDNDSFTLQVSAAF